MRNTAVHADVSLVAGIFRLVATPRGAEGDGWTALLAADPGCRAYGRTPAAAVGALVLGHPAPVARAYAAAHPGRPRPARVDRAFGRRATGDVRYGYDVVLPDGRRVENYIVATLEDRARYEESVADELRAYRRPDLAPRALEVAGLAALACGVPRAAADDATFGSSYALLALGQSYALDEYQVASLVGLAARYAVKR